MGNTRIKYQTLELLNANDISLFQDVFGNNRFKIEKSRNIIGLIDLQMSTCVKNVAVSSYHSQPLYFQVASSAVVQKLRQKIVFLNISRT